MSDVTTIGIDLAKNVFQIHGVDKRGKAVLRKQLRRDQVAEFFANLPVCLIGMEACARGYQGQVLQSNIYTLSLTHGQTSPY